jgi:signal transduction histidine kinase
MEFSRPASEDFEQISIIQTIQSAVSLVFANLESAGSHLEVELDQQLPTVLGNQRQLEALWVNLLLLARDAAEKGRSHTIRISASLSEPASVVVEVCDDGRPIPSDQITNIFEPDFFTTQRGRGTGIEFSICREIVRQHNGQITAESGQANQTLIRVTLPGKAQ